MNAGPGDTARIVHVASHRINVGDGALISAIQDGMRRHAAPSRIAFENFDIVSLESTYEGASFDDVPLDDVELILVGGGGTIDNRRDRTQSGMAFPLSGDNIRALDTPLAYVGVGYNLFGGTRLRHGEALADVIRACRERGFPFSVRNDGSLRRLREELGAAAEGVVEIPDPGFFIETVAGAPTPWSSGHRPRVLVQPAADNPGFRFSRDGEAGDLLGRIRNRLPWGVHGDLVRQLVGLVRWLVDTTDAEVILAPHIAPDVRLVAEILDALPTRVGRTRVRTLGVPDPTGAAAFFAAYDDADLVVGMRGHSVICAIGLGTPCVGLSSHPKVRGFMEACDLGEWTVDYGPEMEPALRSACGALLADPAAQARRREAATGGFRARFDAFLARCWGLVES